MGEPDDPYTPGQRARLKVFTPEQRAALQKKPADQTPEERAKLDKAREAIERYVAIRDNQIRPPWLEKPQQPASPEARTKAKPKPKPKQKTKPEQQNKTKAKHGPDAMLSSAQIKKALKLLPKLERDPRRWKVKYQVLREKLKTSASDKTLARYVRGLR